MYGFYWTTLYFAFNR